MCPHLSHTRQNAVASVQVAVMVSTRAVSTWDLRRWKVSLPHTRHLKGCPQTSNGFGSVFKMLMRPNHLLAAPNSHRKFSRHDVGRDSEIQRVCGSEPNPLSNGKRSPNRATKRSSNTTAAHDFPRINHPTPDLGVFGTFQSSIPRLPITTPRSAKTTNRLTNEGLTV